MAQKVTGYIKLQIPAAKATASPPVGPALGQHGVNISQFIKEFNERTKDQAGFKIPVIITVYADRSFTFVTKTPPDPDACSEDAGYREGFRRAQQGQGRYHHQSTGQGDRREEDARPDRHHHRGRYDPGRRHLPQHGHHRRRLSWKKSDLTECLGNRPSLINTWEDYSESPLRRILHCSKVKNTSTAPS